MKRVLAGLVALVSLGLLTSCSFGTPGFVDDTLERADARMEQIAVALIDRDADELKSMFSTRALDEAREVDESLQYLLSVVPSGELTWQRRSIDSEGNSYFGEDELLQAIYSIFAGESEYSLYFSEYLDNDTNADDVGLFALGAVLMNTAKPSFEEAAFHTWRGTVDMGGGLPGIFAVESDQPSHNRAAGIVDAVNSQDAAALRAMFTDYARAEFSTEIVGGANYLLSLFPSADLVVHDDEGGFWVTEQVDGEDSTTLRSSFYRVSSGGVDYWLFFAEFTENSIDPDNVGIYGIGAVPVSSGRNQQPEAQIYHWTMSFELDASNDPGIFYPTY